MPHFLNRNEYLCPHAKAVLNGFSNFAQQTEYLTRYTNTNRTQILTKTLATDLKIHPSSIFLGHGAEDLLVKIFSFYRHSKLWLGDFSWTNYNIIAEGLGMEVHGFACPQQNLTYSTDLIFLKLALKNNQISCPSSTSNISLKSPDLICITTPNNPTGHSVGFDKISELASEFPEHLFLIDAVYDDYPSPLAQLPHAHSNTIFLGSFSKYFGVPGLRVGFAVGNLPAGFRLNLGLAPQAVELCLTALSEKKWYGEHRKQMLEFAKALCELKFNHLKVFQTDATFILVRIENQLLDESIFDKAEAETDIIPKYFEREGFQYLRWSLGENKLNQKITQFLQIIDSNH